MNTRRFHRSWTIALLGLFLIAMTVAPLGAQEALPRNETLYVAGMQWNAPVNWNPLAAQPDWPASGNGNLIYQTLFAFNLATGNLDPWLGKEFAFTDDTTLIVTLQDGTKWQDGEDLTPDDVVFTFGLGKTNDDLRFTTFWNYVASMTATGDRTIEIKLNPDQLNPGIVKDFLATVDILPQHIWADREGGDTPVSQYIEDSPVGSGPYKLSSASVERVVVERDDNFWGIPIYGSPAPKYVVHPIFNSNDEGNLALQRGEVDVSQQFAPQIWKMWEDQNLPVGTWFSEEPYYLPGNIPMLHINIHRPGLDNVLVRRALAYSINYPQIAATAMSRYSMPAQASLIIPTGGEAKFYDADQVAEYGWEYNPDKAKEILEVELGATKGSDGIYVLPDGTRLGPYTAMATFGWTDWLTAIQLMAQSATEAGIEVNTEFPENPVIQSRRNTGDFDMLIWTHSGAGAASPWRRFRDALDDRGVLPMGEVAFWNWGRFSNPDVAGLLDAAAATTDEAEQKAIFGQLNQIFLDNIPEIPLMYRPLEFYEFNETYWTNFPTAENPYAPPQHRNAGFEYLFGIKPVGS